MGFLILIPIFFVFWLLLSVLLELVEWILSDKHRICFAALSIVIILAVSWCFGEEVFFMAFAIISIIFVVVFGAADIIGNWKQLK